MAEDELEEGGEKKSSKKIFIIAGLVVLLLAGAGAGYYFMMGDATETDESQVEEVVEEDENAVEDVYYEMTQPFIVNFPKGSGVSLIQVSVALLVAGEGATTEALKKHEPMIRNNILMAISAKGAKNLKTKEGKEALRADMLEEISQVMEKMTGKNKVKDLFFTTFVMQ